MVSVLPVFAAINTAPEVIKKRELDCGMFYYRVVISLLIRKWVNINISFS